MAGSATEDVIPRMSYAVARQLEASVNGLDFTIDKTWNGEPVSHEPYIIHMEWFFQRIQGRPHKRAVKIYTEGPLLDDPDPPDCMGHCPNLWEYEVLELFFANDKEQYLEVEIGPHGNWLVYLLNGRRKPFNTGEELELTVQNTFEGSAWRSVFEIPLAYFPPNVSKMNAYAIHGSGTDRHYEALYPVTDGNDAEPDFHRLEYFKPLEVGRIIPEGLNDHAFNDMLYGNLWAPVDETSENK